MISNDRDLFSQRYEIDSTKELDLSFNYEILIKDFAKVIKHDLRNLNLSMKYMNDQEKINSINSTIEELEFLTSKNKNIPIRIVNSRFDVKQSFSLSSKDRLFLTLVVENLSNYLEDFFSMQSQVPYNLGFLSLTCDDVSLYLGERNEVVLSWKG